MNKKTAGELEKCIAKYELALDCPLWSNAKVGIDLEKWHPA